MTVVYVVSGVVMWTDTIYLSGAQQNGSNDSAHRDVHVGRFLL